MDFTEKSTCIKQAAELSFGWTLVTETEPKAAQTGSHRLCRNSRAQRRTAALAPAGHVTGNLLHRKDVVKMDIQLSSRYVRASVFWELVVSPESGESA